MRTARPCHSGCRPSSLRDVQLRLNACGIDNFFGRKHSRQAVQSSAWMSAVTTEKQITDRRVVARPAQNRSRDEKLIEGELTMEDLASG